MKKKKRSEKKKKIKELLSVFAGGQIGIIKDEYSFFEPDSLDLLSPASCVVAGKSYDVLSEMGKSVEASSIGLCNVGHIGQNQSDLLNGELSHGRTISSCINSAESCFDDINKGVFLATKEMASIPKMSMIADEVSREGLNLCASAQLNTDGVSCFSRVTKEVLGFQSLAVTATEINRAVDTTIGLFHNSLQEYANTPSVLDQALFAVPSSFVAKEIDEFSHVSLVVDDFRQFGVDNNDYQIATVITEERKYGHMILQAVQKTGMIVENMNSRFDRLDDIVSDQNKKFEKLMVDCSEKGGQVVRVKNVFYKCKTFQLVIDGQCIPIPAGTDRHDLCIALFGKPRNMWEPVELLGIMESFGVDMVNVNGDVVGEWNKRISGTVRHLCDHIARCSGPKDFLKYKKRVAFINPVYLGLVT